MYELKENERWVKDYEGRYFVNTYSEVWSLVKGNPKKLVGGVIHSKERNNSTYRTMCLTHKDGVSESKYLHRIIAEAFIPNPENKPTVNHINGRKQDNHIENLEWATWSEQVIHAYENLPRKDSKLEIQMRDPLFRDNVIDTFIKQGTQLIPEYFLLKHITDDDFIRNGVPPELFKTGELKQKSILDKWLVVLVLGCSIENGKSLSQMNKLTGADVTLISKVRSGQRGKKLMDIYHKYKQLPEYVDRHIAKISLTYNGNYKDL